MTRQREDIAALARHLGWPEVTEVYQDNDFSADTRKKRVRPAFQRLLADMRAGRITHVLVYDQDRLVRDMRELEDVADAAEVGNVLLTSVNGDIDLLTDNGRFVARIKAAVGRNEIEKMSRRIKRANLQRAQAGHIPCGPRPFGFTRDLAHDPEEAPWVLEVYRRKAEGESLASLSRMLNSSGVRTTGMLGNWSAGQVSSLLKRRIYVGDITIRDEVIGPAAFVPIVDRDLFERANRALAAASIVRSSAERGLLTPVISCGDCDGQMATYNIKGTHHQYRCMRTRGNCGVCSIVEAPTDRSVVRAVRQKEVAGLGRSSRRRQSRASIVTSAEGLLIEEEISQAIQLHAAGELATLDLVPILRTLRTRLAKEQHRTPSAPDTADRERITWDTDWPNWPLTRQRQWVGQYVERVAIAKLEGIGGAFKPWRIAVHFKDGEVRRMPPVIGVRDVARSAGCSTTTVYTVLRGEKMSVELTARVWIAVRETGYEPSAKVSAHLKRLATRTDGTGDR